MTLYLSLNFHKKCVSFVTKKIFLIFILSYNDNMNNEKLISLQMTQK